MAYSSQPPPQAYTKEVLSEAYTWLMSQPESVRAKAQNADSLIGLYLRAKRQGLTDKVSAEEFKSELKNLAGMMNNFSPETVKPQPSPPATEESPQPAKVAKPTAPQASPASPKVKSTPVAPPSSSFSLSDLDGRTQMALYEVKSKLNLSSESEALKMLIQVGLKHLRPHLPDPE